MKEITKKSNVIDIVRGITIFLVVFGHAIQYGSGREVINNGLFFDAIIFKFIYSFHMPLFMLISGYLFAGTIARYSFAQVLESRVTKLIIPIIMWSFIPYMIVLFQINLSGLGMIKKFIGTVVREYWFLWAIFYCSMAVLLVSQWFKDNLVVYLIGIIVSFIVPDIYNFQLYKYMYPFFLIGYFWHKSSCGLKYKIFEKFKNIKGLAVLILGYIIMFFFYERRHYIYISGFTLIGKKWNEQLGIDIYRTVIGLLGSVITILLIDIFCRRVPKGRVKYLAVIGEKSLGIYIISGLIFSYILPQITGSLSNINYIRSLFQTVLIIIISFIITIIIQRVPLLNKLLFGGRS